MSLFQPVPSQVLTDLEEEDLEELFDDAAEGSDLEDNWGEAMQVNTGICHHLLSSPKLIQPFSPLVKVVDMHHSLHSSSPPPGDRRQRGPAAPGEAE